MHNIEPYYRWHQFYDSSNDENSPFYGKQYNFDLYSERIYNYFIDPGWDNIGSETIFIKVLFADYQNKLVIIEMIGEWNDAINNDVMTFKRNIIDHFLGLGINKFIVIGENVFNFHGSDDCYYEEWFEDVEEGWIVFLNFQNFVLDEMSRYNIDYFVNFGGNLQIDNWRTFSPVKLFQIVDQLIVKRLS